MWNVQLLEKIMQKLQESYRQIEFGHTQLPKQNIPKRDKNRTKKIRIRETLF